MFQFPNFKQLDAMDCGPASLKIIVRYYGKSFSMRYLRDLCNVDREGVSLLGIGREGLRSAKPEVIGPEDQLCGPER